MNTIIVTGGTSGLGRAIVSHLARTHEFWDVVGLGVGTIPERNRPNETFLECDVTDVTELLKVRSKLTDLNPVRIIVNCAGVNYQNWADRTSQLDFQRVMEVNAASILGTYKNWMYDLHRTRGTILNIVSNAAYTPMTASIAYNASKAAAHIMTKQMARELTPKYGMTVFGISPSKLEGTPMSSYIEQRVTEVRGWTEEEAREYQLNGLLLGREIPVENLAKFVAWLLSSKRNHEFFSGLLIPYGATR